MLTGVIYGAIVVVWAAYLVPLALRRHDEASHTRSVERFTSSMRVLGRRPSVVEDAGAGGLDEIERPEPERVLVTPTRNRAAERAAAARRQKILLGLVALTVLVGIASFVGKLAAWSVAVPVLLIVMFLVTARISVRRATRPHWVELPAEGAERPRTAAGTAAADDDEPTIGLSAGDRRKAAGVEPLDTPPVQFLPPAPLPQPAQLRATSGTLWDPVPVTLPTYVSAPVATRSIRTIDLAGPGVWSSGHEQVPEQPAGSMPVQPVGGDTSAEGGDDVAQVVNG